MGSHEQERGIAGMKRRIAVDADDIESVLIDQLRQRDVFRRRFVGLQGNADLAHRSLEGMN